MRLPLRYQVVMERWGWLITSLKLVAGAADAVNFILGNGHAYYALTINKQPQLAALRSIILKILYITTTSLLFLKSIKTSFWDNVTHHAFILAVVEAVVRHEAPILLAQVFLNFCRRDQLQNFLCQRGRLHNAS